MTELAESWNYALDYVPTSYLLVLLTEVSIDDYRCVVDRIGQYSNLLDQVERLLKRTV